MWFCVSVLVRGSASHIEATTTINITPNDLWVMFACALYSPRSGAAAGVIKGITDVADPFAVRQKRWSGEAYPSDL